MNEINIYCDESNHLECESAAPMVLGAILCPKDKRLEVTTRIKEIRERHGLKINFEIKWTKISPAKINFYKDLIDYFFDNDELHFRGVVIDKKKLDHTKYHQTHDEWYYKMYFELLVKLLDPQQVYDIYIDIKDTRGQKKVEKLHEVLCKSMFDFERKILKKVQQARSHEVSPLQIADLLMGALQFANRTDVRSVAKKELVERIRIRSGYDLSKSTLPKEIKFNIFHWVGGRNEI